MSDSTQHSGAYWQRHTTTPPPPTIDHLVSFLRATKPNQQSPVALYFWRKAQQQAFTHYNLTHEEQSMVLLLLRDRSR